MYLSTKLSYIIVWLVTATTWAVLNTTKSSVFLKSKQCFSASNLFCTKHDSTYSTAFHSWKAKVSNNTPPIPSHSLYYILVIYMKKEKRTIETSHWLTTLEYLEITLHSLRLHVSSPVDDVSSRRGDVNGVQDGPQYLAKWSKDGEISFDILKTHMHNDCPIFNPITPSNIFTFMHQQMWSKSLQGCLKYRSNSNSLR